MIGEILFMTLMGLCLGCIYALVAVGISITLGYMRILNVAHGAFYTIGAYVLAFYVFQLGLLGSLAMAFVVAALVGVVVERSLLSRAYGKPLHYTLLFTYALALMIMKIYAILFGVESRPVPDPIGVIVGIPFTTMTVSVYRFVVIIATFLLYGFLWVLLTRTMLGKTVMAGIENYEFIQGLGINPLRPFVTMFCLGAGLAAIGGVFHSPFFFAQPYIGREIGIIAIVTCIMGKLTDFKAILISAIVLGESAAFASYLWGPSAYPVAYIAFAITLVLQARAR